MKVTILCSFEKDFPSCCPSVQLPMLTAWVEFVRGVAVLTQPIMCMIEIGLIWISDRYCGRGDAPVLWRMIAFECSSLSSLLPTLLIF